MHNSDITIDLRTRDNTLNSNSNVEDWRVTLADTGLKTMTGGRLKRVEKYLDKNEPFLLTYADGLSTIDIKQCVKCHRASGKLATVTAVHPAGRFGEIELDGTAVSSFAEKPQTGQGYINGGYMVLEREFIRRYVSDDPDCVLEADALAKCAQDGQLNAYLHDGFWQCVDTAREYHLLNEMWEKEAPWKIW